MGLTKYKIGDLVEHYSETCGISNLSTNDVSGINRNKEFFEPSKQVGSDTSKYKIVPTGYFACNLIHVGRDIVLPVALNQTYKNKIVSQAYTVFKIKMSEIVISEYFFLMINSPEKDRRFWFHTDSSIRDGMSWEDFCNIEINLPSLEIQQKYVDIYNAMKLNQQSYETGLEDLKLTCDAYVEKLQKELIHKSIGPYIELSEKKNKDLKFGINDVRGIATTKEFIDTKADMTNVSLKHYYIVTPNEFAFVADTSRRGDKMSLAYNNNTHTYLVSSISTVFKVVNNASLIPHYLSIFFALNDFDRYARFHSWGSARETFSWDDMCNVKIPIPDIEIQQAIVDIYTVYQQRKEINERLKQQIKDICPILIKGALEEGGNS